MNEFDQLKDPEVIDFRRNVLSMCKTVVEDREARGKMEHAVYVYPPNLEVSEELPKHVFQRLDKGTCPVVLTHSYRNVCDR